MNETETTRLRARFTGNHSVTYRWVGAVGGGHLIPAQKHPQSRVVDDTWSSDVDNRIPRKTVVEVPAGLLMVDSERVGNSVTVYTAAILCPGSGANVCDWSAATHVQYVREPADPRLPNGNTIGVHYVAVSGNVGRYIVD